jgi:hypothetical protein
MQAGEQLRDWANAERMLNRLPVCPHRIWHAIEPLLHGLNNGFVLPALMRRSLPV